MDIRIEEQIEKLKQEIKNEYKNIMIDYHYDSEEDLYLIYHNNSELQYNDNQFLDFVGGLLREYILNKEIYNVGFGYDYDFDIRMKAESKKYKDLNRLSTYIEYNYINIEKNIGYASNISLGKTKDMKIIPDDLSYNKKCNLNNKQYKYNVKSVLNPNIIKGLNMFKKDEKDDVAWWTSPNNQELALTE